MSINETSEHEGFIEQPSNLGDFIEELKTLITERIGGHYSLEDEKGEGSKRTLHVKEGSSEFTKVVVQKQGPTSLRVAVYPKRGSENLHLRGYIPDFEAQVRGRNIRLDSFFQELYWYLKDTWQMELPFTIIISAKAMWSNHYYCPIPLELVNAAIEQSIKANEADQIRFAPAHKKRAEVLQQTGDQHAASEAFNEKVVQIRSEEREKEQHTIAENKVATPGKPGPGLLPDDVHQKRIDTYFTIKTNNPNKNIKFWKKKTEDELGLTWRQITRSFKRLGCKWT